MDPRRNALLASAGFPVMSTLQSAAATFGRYCFTSRIARLAPTSASSGKGEATDDCRGSIMRVARQKETNRSTTTLPRIAAPEGYL